MSTEAGPTNQPFPTEVAIVLIRVVALLLVASKLLDLIWSVVQFVYSAIIIPGFTEQLNLWPIVVYELVPLVLTVGLAALAFWKSRWIAVLVTQRFQLGE